MSEQKPLLVVIAGPMGAGKTTFYDAHLKEAFPTLIPPISHKVLCTQMNFDDNAVNQGSGLIGDPEELECFLDGMLESQ